MRVCRFQDDTGIHAGFLVQDEIILPVPAAERLTGIELGATTNLLDLLPGGRFHAAVGEMEDSLTILETAAEERAVADVQLLVPLELPHKLLLLAGNYSEHVQESGDRAEEREHTFPYVFMKPPTTLTNPGDPVRIPAISPTQIDWELELAVIIGRPCAHVTAETALDYVAGYTIVNDISDRHFKPNPQRSERPRDKFFDWLHGKWHDTFCPMGPCILPADEVPDPQELQLELRLNGTVEQQASTAEMIFPVADIIAFVSQMMSLQPGDVISTGTPAGVGKAKGKFLKPGDVLEAEIREIGVLRNPVI